MSNQLTADANNTEAQILSKSPYDQSSNPSGVQNGEIYFATDTKKVFLALVSGTSVTWRVVESGSVTGDTSLSPIQATSPMLWVDANNSYSMNDKTEGEKIDTIKDISGNDFHSVQNYSSYQYTHSKDGNVSYFDRAGLTPSNIRYRPADIILGQLKLRIGSMLKFSGGATSFLVVFKLDGPWAKGSGIDQSGGYYASDAHSDNYEDCTTFGQKLNCKHTQTATHSLFPFYGRIYFGANYSHVTTNAAARYGGIFTQNLWCANNAYINPKAGIFDNCFQHWNTLFVRAPAGGKAVEMLLNGKNFIALSRPMLEGQAKTHNQLGWTTTAPPGLPLALNDKWEKNTEEQALTTFYTQSGSTYYFHPYVEQGYEYYPMDGHDGGASGTTGYGGEGVEAYNGLHYNDGKMYHANKPQGWLWDSSVNSYSGAKAHTNALTSNSVATTAANNLVDYQAQEACQFAEWIGWKRRISDEERNSVLQDIHAKYQGLGDGMPSLPTSSAAGNSSGMMPSKSSVMDPPWI